MIVAHRHCCVKNILISESCCCKGLELSASNLRPQFSPPYSTHSIQVQQPKEENYRGTNSLPKEQQQQQERKKIAISMAIKTEAYITPELRPWPTAGHNEFEGVRLPAVYQSLCCSTAPIICEGSNASNCFHNWRMSSLTTRSMMQNIKDIIGSLARMIHFLFLKWTNKQRV